MLDVLRLYQGGKVPLGGLIAKVKAILSVISDESVPLRQKLFYNWGILEQCHAYALYKLERKEIKTIAEFVTEPSQQRRIDDAVEEMRRMLEEHLNNNGETDAGGLAYDLRDAGWHSEPSAFIRRASLHRLRIVRTFSQHCLPLLQGVGLIARSLPPG